jgi:trehalose 6-phosphate phosphatase
MSIPVQALGVSPALLVLLDYDGTLIGLRGRPELARLSTWRRRLLDELGRTAVLAIVTGRGLGEIQGLVGIPSLAYIGNHGLEIAHGNRTWVHPGATERRGDLASVLRRIRTRTADLAGVIVEDKGLTAGIHYRLLDHPRVGRLKGIVHEELERRGAALKAAYGKKVIEIRPNLDWDKGRGVLEFMGWLGPAEGRSLIYIGDDRTDEDAFRVLAGVGATVRVGTAKDSSAEFRLRGVGQVWALLRALTALRCP